jgi:cardiolipin synthase A/B
MWSDPFVWLSILFYGYLAITIIYLLLDNREPSTTIAWILVLVLLPVLGFVFYFFFGRNWRKRKKNNQIAHRLIEKRLHLTLAPLIRKHKNILHRTTPEWLRPKYKKDIAQMLFSDSDSLLTEGNKVDVFFQGADTFGNMKMDMEQAQSSIFLEYFIWRKDALTDSIREILIRKARAGIRVCILVDSLGSLSLSGRYIRSLRKAGVKIFKYYNFLSLVRLHTLNYRNHRKIVSIDGRVAYTGGMNMGQEYIDGGKRFKMWRDTHLRIEGHAASVIQSIFAVDWYNTTHEDLFHQGYCLPRQKVSSQPKGIVQITTSGPDSNWPSIKQLFFAMINSAEKTIHIQTPYFIPDPSVFMALKTASLRGVDVHIMITGVPDKKLPYWSAFTYFEKLLLAGVHIYHYQTGFLHAKTICVDSQICSVGTANMDLRSFSLNYELNTLLYDATITRSLEQQFYQDQRKCRELLWEDYIRLPAWKHFAHSLARLFAPIL